MRVYPLKEDNLKGLEDFVNRLYDMVAKLKDAGHEQELVGTSVLYTIVLQKIPDSLLVQYHDTRPKSSPDGLTTFVQWLNRQVSIRLEMAELKESSKKQRQENTSKSSLLKDKGNMKKSQSRSHAAEATSSDLSNSKAQRNRTNTAEVAESFERQQSRPTSNRESTSGAFCPVCQGKHRIASCDKWRESAIPDRWSLAKQHNICFRCLIPGHQGRTCISTRKCGINGCEKTHHRSLHPTTLEGSSTQTEARPKTQTKQPDKSSSSFGIKNGEIVTSTVALRIVPVLIYDSQGCRRKVNAFLDDGSDSTYVKSSLVEALGLTIEKRPLYLSTLVETDTEVDSGLVQITIESLDGETRTQIGARTLGRLCETLRSPDWNSLQGTWPHLEGLEFPALEGRGVVDILIGSDHPELTLALEERVGSPGDPVARRTPLGWTCVGSLDQVEMFGMSNPTTICNASAADIHLDEELRRMWEMDTITSKTEILSPDEKQALEKTSKSISYDGTRYTVKIPWKEESPNLPDNRSSAERRLYSLEKNLSRRPEVAERYREAMQNNIDQGYIRKVDPQKDLDSGWYLPHFAVVKEDRSTTKVRVVYDAAAVHLGKSLNEEMHAGPKLQLDIIDILVKFRQGKIAIVGDIREMFSQIVIPAEDARYHRILWRNMDIDKPIEVYEAVRLPFGDRASPFLAQYVIKTHAEKLSAEYPLAAESCLKNIYIDDSLNSVDTPQEATDLRKQLAELLEKGGFTIRKWCTNHAEVMQGIPEKDRVEGALQIEDSGLPSVKTLGIKWDADKDVIGYAFSAISLGIATKRSILSLAAKLFDPLQLLAPFVIRAKIILQESWIEGLQWDEPFPPALNTQIRDWIAELPSVGDFEVPRCYKKETPTETSLHTFTDASGQAYGAVSYIRNVYSDGSVTVRIVMAKARVTPLKAVSIPRLELMAAVLGLQLATKIKELLGITCLVWWTDSMDVLHWIRGQSRKYKPFIAHRISKIQSDSSPVQWRHVPGKINPADLASRGSSMTNLINDSSWTTGPEFLLHSEEHWPVERKDEQKELSPEAQEELPKSQML